MRARHRHLNYAAMGASAVYDARFLALADNDPVSSWTDRSASANNATQTGSERPTFKTNQFNGQPGVQFTSAGSSWLSLSSEIAVAFTSETIVVDNRATNQSSIAFGVGVANNAAAVIIGSLFTNFYYVYGANGQGCDTSSIPTGSNIWCVSPNSRILANGTALSVTARSGTGFNANRIGRRSGQYSNSTFGCIAYFGSALSAAARKRAQHAAAYSFKIACS